MRTYRRVKKSIIMPRRIWLKARFRSHDQVAPKEDAKLMATLKAEDGNNRATPSPEDMSREVPTAPPSPPETTDPPSAPEEGEGAPSLETVMTLINTLPTTDQVLSVESIQDDDAGCTLRRRNKWAARASSAGPQCLAGLPP